ncbi:MAG: hypothetical protein HGA85_03875 [Nanoarchaeota archaeon]|nr:hypothetical protein [Nanoarchaeota archaeon]
MYKTILTPTETGLLIPHWYDINPKKISRIDRVCTRTSRFGFGPKANVMNVPAILIDDEGYILNGRHRAYWATKHGYSLETCVVSEPREVRFHVPSEVRGELSVEEIIDSLDKKDTYIRACNEQGIFSINDLVKKY